MLRIALMTLLVMASIATDAVAQEQLSARLRGFSILNGHDWVEFSSSDNAALDLYRTAFLKGVIDGVMTVPLMMIHEDAVQTQYGETVTRLVTGISLRQVSDGVEHLYTDFKNRRIPWTMAAYIVLLQISGEDDFVVSGLIEYFRKFPGTSPAPPAR